MDEVERLRASNERLNNAVKFCTGLLMGLRGRIAANYRLDEVPDEIDFALKWINRERDQAHDGEGGA